MKVSMKIQVLAVMIIFSFGILAQDAFEAQLEEGVNYWNQQFGANVTAVNWYFGDVIADQGELDDVIDRLITPELVYVTRGGSHDPDRVGAQPLTDANPYELLQWEAAVRSVAALGQTLAVIEWEDAENGVRFESLVLGDASGVVFDSMLSTITLTQPSRAGGGVVIQWIWGGKRGEITWSVSCVKNVCIHKCDAWMALGDAQISCQVIPGQGFCRLVYGYGWRTPTGNIKIGWNGKKGKFDVTVTGLGSSGSGNGSVVDFCG